MAYNPYNDLHGLTTQPSSIDEQFLQEMEQIEAKRTNLVKVKVKCGYVMTNNPEKYKCL